MLAGTAGRSWCFSETFGVTESQTRKLTLPLLSLLVFANRGAYLTPILFVLLGSVGAFLLLRRSQRRGREIPPAVCGRATAIGPRVEAHLASLE